LNLVHNTPVQAPFSVLLIISQPCTHVIEEALSMIQGMSELIFPSRKVPGSAYLFEFSE
jgi:hypothetical protein